MIGIITVLLVLGIILLILGITKKTGFQGDWNEGMALLFFIVGIMHLVAALFLFNSPIPLGSIVNQTTTYSTDYAEFMNDSVICVDCGCENCSGEFDVDWCAQFLTEEDCAVCDQCAWDQSCGPIQDASCDATDTCEDCGCNATDTAYCCEHDFNTTISGSITNEFNYFTKPENDIGGTFFIIWLFLLLFYSAIYGLSYLRRSFTERGKLW